MPDKTAHTWHTTGSRTRSLGIHRSDLLPGFSLSCKSGHHITHALSLSHNACCRRPAFGTTQHIQHTHALTQSLLLRVSMSCQEAPPSASTMHIQRLVTCTTCARGTITPTYLPTYLGRSRAISAFGNICAHRKYAHGASCKSNLHRVSSTLPSKLINSTYRRKRQRFCRTLASTRRTHSYLSV